MATVNGPTTTPDRPDLNQLSYHEQYAQMQIRNNLGEIQNDIPALVSTKSQVFVEREVLTYTA